MSIRINRVYTRTGDRGDTGLVGGSRISKSDLRIECLGAIDELNALLGMTRLYTARPSLSALDEILQRIQNELFNLGSILATKETEMPATQPRLEERHIQQLEMEIDAWNTELPELLSFVLPGGSPVAAHLHLARAVCRRAERVCVALSEKTPLPKPIVPYLNRLSDALFVFARRTIFKAGDKEVLWIPEKT